MMFTEWYHEKGRHSKTKFEAVKEAWNAAVEECKEKLDDPSPNSVEEDLDQVKVWS